MAGPTAVPTTAEDALRQTARAAELVAHVDVEVTVGHYVRVQVQAAVGAFTQVTVLSRLGRTLAVSEHNSIHLC